MGRVCGNCRSQWYSEAVSPREAPSYQEAFEQEPTELSQHSGQRVGRGGQAGDRQSHLISFPLSFPQAQHEQGPPVWTSVCALSQ